MSLIEKAKQMLTLDEGKHCYLYDDANGQRVRAPIGKITGGVGHNFEAKPLSNYVINIILEEDIAEAELIAINYIGVDKWTELGENRKLGLINLAFNLGSTGLFKFKKLKAAILKNDWETAGIELASSLWARQVDRMGRINKGRDDRVINLLQNDIFQY